MNRYIITISMKDNTMMNHILPRLSAHGIKYEKISSTALRVYGNFRGFSSVREGYDGWAEVNGKFINYDDFESWLYSITI